LTGADVSAKLTRIKLKTDLRGNAHHAVGIRDANLKRSRTGEMPVRHLAECLRTGADRFGWVFHD
jgi:hypothetical protein